MGFVNECFDQSGISIKKIIGGAEDITAILTRLFETTPYGFSCIFRQTVIEIVELIEPTNHTDFGTNTTLGFPKVGISAHRRRCKRLHGLSLIHISEPTRLGM